MKFDANGNTVDAGAACGSGGGGGTPGSTYFTYVNAAGTGPNNTATETSLIGSPTTGSKTIPANTFTAGAVTRFDIEGDLTTPASPDNLTLNMYMGATNVGSATITGSNIPGLTASHYKMTMTLGMSAGGASCAMLIDDVVLVAGAAAAKGAVNFQSSGTTFDCTAAQAFDFKAQWAGAQAGESIVGTVVALYTPGAPVISFNSRTGAIAPTTGDYTCAQVTNCIVSVPTQFAAANNAVTFPALPNAYKADVNSPYVQNAGIRRTSSLFANPNGNTATVGMSNTNTGSTVWVAPGASSPGMVQIPVANNSPVGIVETSVAHRTGRTNGMTLECMGANTVITAIRAIPCGLTSTTLANSLGADVPGSFSMAYIVFSTTGVYTSGTDTTHYMLCTVNGTTQNCVSTGVAFDANVHRFRLFEDIANSRWTGCVDGTCVNNATDNPASGTNLAFVGGAFGIAAASGNWQLAYAQTTEDYK